MSSLSNETGIASSARPAHIGLIVSEDFGRYDVYQRQTTGTTSISANASNTETAFSMMVERVSRARWFILIRRIFHYQNGREGSDMRLNPLNSLTWICLEAVMAVSQIVAVVVILGIAHNERPVAPLRLWVIGYSMACCASLPVLYWRYRHPYIDSATAGSSVEAARNLENVRRSGQIQNSASANAGNSRMALCMERCRMSLDFFFAVWFVIGNVWVFGARGSFTDDAPILHRLCIALLALSCIGYALPFILFAVLCCCMPCISSIFGLSMATTAKHRGATSSDIAALPTHTFKTLNNHHPSNTKSRTNNSNNNDSSSDSDTDRIGGYTVDTEAGKKRRISAAQAECCICLAKYKDGDTLKELPCLHLFHADCVDQWLKINSTCPLCKRELIAGSKGMAYELEDMSRRVIDMARFPAP